jgi:hypothetical protein
MASLTSSRLLILACSATKRDGPAYMPAIERYDGPLWKTLRAADLRSEKAIVAFLSAHLGFRAANTPIEMYDALDRAVGRFHERRRPRHALAKAEDTATGHAGRRTSWNAHLQPVRLSRKATIP